MNAEFIAALEQIETEKGISKEILFEALESALLNAYKKNFGTSSNVRVEMDKDKGEVKVFSRKSVVNKYEYDLGEGEISVEEAQERYGPNYGDGDVIEEEVTPKNFGRIAAQAATEEGHRRRGNNAPLMIEGSGLARSPKEAAQDERAQTQREIQSREQHPKKMNQDWSRYQAE